MCEVANEPKTLWQCHCALMDAITKKPVRKFWKALLFPVFLLTISFVVHSLRSAIEERRRYAYRTDPKYRKVIKEGVFFDTTEYHER